MPLPYSNKLLEYFRHPRNAGEMKNPDAKATEGSPACGDMVTLYLKVDKRTNRIIDVKFESFGCASNIASGSIITEMAKGKTLEEAKKISWKDAASELGGLPPIKVHCSVLAVDVLKAAIENYEEKNRLVKEKKETTKDIVLSRLKHVINPVVGFDIVKTNIVKKIKVSKGVIKVSIGIPYNHQFAKNIEEEIKERLESLWDIKRVEVSFDKT